LIWESETCFIEENTLSVKGIAIYGRYLQHYDSHIINNCTLDGNPIEYFVNKSGIDINPISGQIIIVNCSKFIIDGAKDTVLNAPPFIIYSNTFMIANQSINIGSESFQLKECRNGILSSIELRGTLGELLIDESEDIIFHDLYINEGVELDIEDSNSISIFQSRISNGPTKDIDFDNSKKILFMNTDFIQYESAYFMGIHDLVFSNCVFKGVNNFIKFSDCYDINLNECQFQDSYVDIDECSFSIQSSNFTETNMRVSECNDSLITGNVWFASAIELIESKYIEISNNTFRDEPDYVIELTILTNNCKIFHNNFIDNAYEGSQSSQGWEERGTPDNHWDDGAIIGNGNYWSDYNGTDSTGDGIGDSAYEIDGYDDAQDDYPFISPLSLDFERDVRPFIVLMPMTKSVSSDVGQIRVIWTSHDIDDDAQISIYYDIDTDLNDGQIITDNLKESDGYGFYSWNWTKIPHGTYYLYAAVDDGVNEPYIQCNGWPIEIPEYEWSGPPILTIVSPSIDEIVAGIVEIEVEAISSGNISTVNYSVDNGSWYQMDAQSDDRWIATLSTTTLVDGDRQIIVQARDDSNQTSSIKLNIDVDNSPPEISIIEPSESVSGTVEVECEVIDAHIDYVQCRINNGSWMSMGQGSTWIIDWDSTTVEDGVHSLEVEAVDVVSNSAKMTIDFEVNNSQAPAPLWISIGSPEEGSIRSGSIRLSGTAGEEDILDSIAVSVYEIDGDRYHWFEPDGLASWSVIWNSSLHPDGGYTIHAHVNSTDDRSEKTVVNITINNTNPPPPPPDNEAPEVEIVDESSHVEAGTDAEFEIRVFDPDGLNEINRVDIMVKIIGSTVISEGVPGSIWSTGTFTYIVDTEDMSGTYTFEVTVEDIHGEIAIDNTTFIVQPPNDPGGPDVDDGSRDEGDTAGINPIILVLIGLGIVVIIAINLSRRKKVKPISIEPEEIESVD
jgi:hypothetical protein